MINKIYKIIHNNYSRFLKFFFFLRYVFAIFLISIFLFLLIPKFFNYEKKQEIIKEYLVNYYDLELSNYGSIEFNVFPIPNLSIKNINLKVKDKPVFFNTKNFIVSSWIWILLCFWSRRNNLRLSSIIYSIYNNYLQDL